MRCLGVGVLGLEVGDHLRVVLVAQPLVGVDDAVAVVLADVLDPFGARRGRHGCSLVTARRRHVRRTHADPTARTLTTRCVVAGGGPAGMMLGFLLARAGVDVVVLEKHGDFLRDFRGDTIHPSTLEVIAPARPARRFRPLLHERDPPAGRGRVGDTG